MVISQPGSRSLTHARARCYDHSKPPLFKLTKKPTDTKVPQNLQLIDALEFLSQNEAC